MFFFPAAEIVSAQQELSGLLAAVMLLVILLGSVIGYFGARQIILSLTAGRSRASFVPKDNEGWKRSEGASTTGIAEALLVLAPLQATRVVGYGRATAGPAVLTASLEQPQLAPVVRRFFAAREGEGYDVVRGERPLRYRIPAAPVKRLIELVQTK